MTLNNLKGWIDTLGHFEVEAKIGKFFQSRLLEREMEAVGDKT